MSVLMKIRVGDHASDVLAVEIVVGDVDVPDAPVGVVVAVGARTEGAVIPQGRGAPVVFVMAEMEIFRVSEYLQDISQNTRILKIFMG